LFEHARRVVYEIHGFARHMAPQTSLADPATDLPKLRRAWERTQEMQAIFFAFVGALKEPDAQAS